MALVREVLEGKGRCGQSLSQTIDAVKPWVYRDVRGVDRKDVRATRQVVHCIRYTGTDQVDTFDVLYRRGQVEDVVISRWK